MRAKQPLLMAVFALAAGCAGATRLYEGPALSSSEVVVLEVDPTGMHLQSIDDWSVSGYRFELLPGKHTVRFDVGRGIGFSGGGGSVGYSIRTSCLVEFIGEAARSYRLEARMERRPVPGGRQDLFLDVSVSEIGGTQKFEGVCGGRA